MSEKTFTLEEANKMLPLVRAIATDIVRQYQALLDLIIQLLACIKELTDRTAAGFEEPFGFGGQCGHDAAEVFDAGSGGKQQLAKVAFSAD